MLLILAFIYIQKEAKKAAAACALGLVQVAQNLAESNVSIAKDSKFQTDAKQQVADKGRECAEIATLVAEKANKAKSEFLTNMSHEIRTPILKAMGVTATQASITQDVPIMMKRRGIETRLIIGNQQEHEPCLNYALIKAIAKAKLWFNELATGNIYSLAAIASREGVSRAHVSNAMNLAFLAPSIVEVIIAGRQPAEVTSEALMKRTDLPFNWSEQESLLGIR